MIFVKAIYLFLFLDFQTNKNSLKFYLFVLMRTNMHGVSHDIFYFSSCLEINMFQKLLIFSCHVLAVQRERPQDPTIFGLEIMFHIQRGHLASHHGVPCRGIQMIVEKEHFFSAMFTDDMWNLIVIIYEGIVNLPGIKM